MTNDRLFVAGSCFFFFSFSLSYSKKYTYFLVVTHFLPKKKNQEKKKKGKSNPKCKKIHMKKAQKITQVDGKGPK
jgi:hypothetical protein